MANNENLPTILVIDNSEIVRNSFRKLLCIDNDFKVVLARTSEEALEAVETIPGPVIIILDQWLKDSAGNDVLGTKLLPELCKHSRMPSLTIICSTDNSISMEHAAIEAGAEWLLPKADAGKLLIPRVQLAIRTFEKMMPDWYDKLTQALLRGNMEKILGRELSRITRIPDSTSESMACVMFDIDGLKVANDNFGHLIGDSLIKGVSASIREHIRRHTDIFCRFGGDEFVLFLSGIKEEEYVQTLINKICITFAKNRVKVSVGFCMISFEDIKRELLPKLMQAHPPGTDVYAPLIKQMIEGADTEMYFQKNIRKGASDPSPLKATPEPS